MTERDELVHAEQVRMMYGQTITAAVSNPLAGGLFLSIFWPVVEHGRLVVWLACLVLVSVVRVPAYLAFLRKEPRGPAMRWWGNLYVGGSFLQGSLWGAAWLVFIPVADPIYLPIAVAWMVGLSASAVSAYSVHLKTLLAFFVPVVLPGAVHLFVIGGQLATSLGLALVLYTAVILRALLPVHRKMLEAIRLNFELEVEISERNKVEDRLREMSRTDGLTGLSNRRHFDDVLEAELRRGQRTSHPTSLLMLDIDFFKAFNDTYGHLAGDACLQRIGQIVEDSAKRPGDLACRYGGEEFAVILPNTDGVSAYAICEEIRKNVMALEISHTGTDLPDLEIVTISGGVTSTEPGLDLVPADLIRRADEALYDAKHSGRNRVSRFTA